MCPNTALAVTMPLTATQKPLSNSGDYPSLEESYNYYRQNGQEENCTKWGMWA